MIENACFRAAGKFTSRRAWIHPEDTLKDCTELIVVISGTVNIEERGIRYSLSPGEVLFLDPDTPHRGFDVTNEKISFYWLHFSGSAIDRVSGIGKHFALSDPNIVSVLFQNVLHYSGLGSGREVNDRLLYVLLYELKRQSCENSGDGDLVHRVREWIRLNSQLNLTSRDVAERFAYSEAYLTRLCKQVCGSGVKELINSYRIALIKRLLLESGMSLSSVASYCGFSDYKLFLKYFKYHTGLTPGGFCKTHYGVINNDK